jgi:hypothetical protein
MDRDNDFEYINESDVVYGDGELCWIIELQNSDY